MNKVLLIGSAPCWYDDLLKAASLSGWKHRVCVNTAGLRIEKDVLLWVSVHGDKLLKWAHTRRMRGWPMNFPIYGNFSHNWMPGPCPLVLFSTMPNWHGSSGLHAVQHAMKQGITKIILCGVPLEGDRTIQEKEIEPEYGGDNLGRGFERYQEPWELHLDDIKDHVRSMSGWTRKLLGEPEEEWMK